MSVVAALQTELAVLAVRDARLAESSLAASALALAARLDDPGTSATAASMCAKVLLETTERIRAHAPAESKESVIDELRQRRDKRRAKAQA